MASIEVTEKDGQYFISDHLLMLVYDAGDCDLPSNIHELVRAIYDLHQCEVFAEDEDVITFRGHQIARVEGYHVIGQKVEALNLVTVANAKSIKLMEVTPAAT